jgi:hypothetical protein
VQPPQSPQRDEPLEADLPRLVKRIWADGVDSEPQKVLCAWTDLLGFGKHFSDCNWRPDAATWSSVLSRLSRLYTVTLTKLTTDQSVLILNDGVVRVWPVLTSRRANPGILEAVDFVEKAFLVHRIVRALEKRSDLPGPRTVIAAGVKVGYSRIEQVDASDLLVQFRGQPTPLVGDSIALNPGFLQMNTAFSRAYLLERAGSRSGLAGPCLFIEDDALSLLEDLAGSARDLELATFIAPPGLEPGLS